MKCSLFVLFLVLLAHHVNAQSVPSGQCGLQYTYDAAGNVTGRDYVCNNLMPPGGESLQRIKNEGRVDAEAARIQQIEAIYPNPNTGQFTVRFMLPLEDALIRIINLNGRIVQQFKASGTYIKCDISREASGMYYIQAADRNTHMIQKVVKQ